jgi:hypothetical protein
MEFPEARNQAEFVVIGAVELKTIGCRQTGGQVDVANECEIGAGYRIEDGRQLDIESREVQPPRSQLRLFFDLLSVDRKIRVAFLSTFHATHFHSYQIHDFPVGPCGSAHRALHRFPANEIGQILPG